MGAGRACGGRTAVTSRRHLAACPTIEPNALSDSSQAPPALLGIPAPGFGTGQRADFTLLPREVTTVRARDLHSRCGWTPFEGREAVFPSAVILGGEVVFREGDFTRGTPQWFPGRGYIS